MKSWKIVVSSLLLAAPCLGAAGAKHAKGHEHSAAPAGGAGEKFVADAALRSRMEKILETMKQLHASEEKKRAAKRLKTAAGTIRSTVDDIFKSCKLPPAADAALHPVLASILEGAALFEKADWAQGHEKVHNAFLGYEKHFLHEGWAHGQE